MSHSIPKVSIIVPNYNHARYLPQRISSILNQTFTDFEVLLLDDCSQDNSREVIAQYTQADARVTSAFNTQNSGGVFKQWQRGLAMTRGEYVWIAESDDFAEPDFLAELVPLLDTDQTVAFAYANSWIVDEHDTRHGTTADWKNTHFGDNHWGENYIVEGRQELQNYLSVACTVNNASAVLFRRSSIEAAGGVHTDFRYTGDWLMYIKLSLQGRIAYRATCLSNYREHASNASKKSEADGSQLFERLKCCAYMYKSGQLGNDAQERMLAWSARELKALLFQLLRQHWQPQKLWHYILGIAAVDKHFYFQLQRRAIVGPAKMGAPSEAKNSGNL
jgi:glycosyltransferase involved in cell wall biosynthesis